MEDCRDATISGFNEAAAQLRAQAVDEGITADISLVTFNHDVTPIYLLQDVTALVDLDRASYVPDGNTAMLDAVGDTLTQIEERTQGADTKNTAFLVSIISDGMENASRSHTYVTIAETIQRLTSKGNWTFTYLGSNQDLSDLSHKLNIPKGNMASYQATPSGSQTAFDVHAASTPSYMSGVSLGVMSTKTWYGKDVTDIKDPGSTENKWDLAARR